MYTDYCVIREVTMRLPTLFKSVRLLSEAVTRQEQREYHLCCDVLNTEDD